MAGEVVVAHFVEESSRAEEEGGTVDWLEAAEQMVAVVLEDIGNHQAGAAVGSRKADTASSQAAAAAVHSAAADRRLADTPAGEGQRREDTLAGDGQHQGGSSLPAEDTVPRTEAARKEVDGRTAAEAVPVPDTAHIGAEGAAGSPKNRDSEDIPAASTLVPGAAVAAEC